MRLADGSLNLLVGWLWIAVGFLFGSYLGLSFDREGWFGGYDSLKRRLYRLAHISFFGLAIVNLLFYFTIRAGAGSDLRVPAASVCFAAGAVAMPLCCLLAAHRPPLRSLFPVPVVCLVVAALLTVSLVVHP